MLKISFKILLIILSASLLLVNCKKTANSPKDSIETVTRLKVNNGDISGWAINTYNVFYSADSWAANGVDGTAYGLQNTHTYSEVMDEHMNGSNGATVTVWVLNYTTTANSTEQYDVSKTMYSSNAESLSPDFPDSVAIGNNSSTSGISVYTHFKQFYIELHFAGYTDFSLSKTDAIIFLQLFEAEINGN